jgi:ADP-dependent NAD(P)H-hydrate dehydratase / NAD(P)H-hydrate epimerase
MKVVTAQQMQALDRKAIEEYGIPGIVLMENAGRGAARAIREAFPDLPDRTVAVLAGKGNNGGDGFVIARDLLNDGIAVEVFLLADPEDLRGDAAVNGRVYFKMGGKFTSLTSVEAFERLKPGLGRFSLFVDAIFGTGLSSEIRGLPKEVIDEVNRLGKPVVAIDVPSGLDASSGRPLGATVRADFTLTFGLPKTGLLTPPGTDYAGEVRVIDISLPRPLVEREPITIHLVEAGEIRGLLSPPRPRNAHKGDFGHLLVLAGSPGKTGAACLTCEAALRMGAGLVTLGIPESLNPILEAKLTEAMTEPLPETGGKTLGLAAYDRILALCEGKRAVVIGPGLGTTEETRTLVLRLLKAIDLPVVLDADGLTALASAPDGFSSLENPRLVLTPHPGEMARLLGITAGAVQADRIGLATGFARDRRVHLVLKGYRTLTVTPEGEVYINPTGNPGMATGGTGDVLTGMIGSLLCQGIDVADGVRAAVYLHGLAGDQAAAEMGERSLVAGDLIRSLPPVLQSLR